jgi:hypothetical protein
MLGVGMLVSFLVGSLSRALPARTSPDASNVSSLLLPGRRSGEITLDVTFLDHAASAGHGPAAAL